MTGAAPGYQVHPDVSWQVQQHHRCLTPAAMSDRIKQEGAVGAAWVWVHSQLLRLTMIATGPPSADFTLTHEFDMFVPAAVCMWPAWSR